MVTETLSAVRSQTSVLKRDNNLTTEVGALKDNVKKNRYKDILPYDQSRVILTLLTSDSDSDYINASIIKGASAGSSYIASQAPLSSTLTDFWRMMWQHHIQVAVMACREVEMGKKKCECYWAPPHQSAAFGLFTVHSQGEARLNEDLVVRTLMVTYQQETRSVVQYQFLSWPDHDVPHEAAGVLDLLERVRRTERTHTSPLLVHCSAGCGRTGVICALDYIHDLLVTKQISADFSIMKIVLQLRTQRPSAVQTKDQYQFIFRAVALMFQQFLQNTAYQPQLHPSEAELHLFELKNLYKKTRRTPASSTKRQSQQADMSDTYAVVNKPKQPHPPSPGPAYATVATPRSSNTSRTLPSGHHYDNDAAGASAAPIYSTVKPRAKLSTTPIYDMATPTNRSETEYQLMPVEHLSQADDDYEDFSSSVTDVTNLCSAGGIGFNCRVQKPRGPRDPPAEWSRLER